jgi:predicted nucleic acid-binding protein
MKSIVVDTSFLVALVDQKDSLHRTARAVDQSLPSEIVRVFPDIVVMEALSVLARRTEERKQKSRPFPEILDNIRKIIPDESITWLSPDIPLIYSKFIEMLRQYEGRPNVNDCILARHLIQSKIGFLLSFDSDFDALPQIVRISESKDFENLIL